MTLLIAGYQFDKKNDYSSAWLDEGDDRSGELEAEPSSIFIVADSAITSGDETLLNGFRKIYSIPVRLWKPYFLDGCFHSYLNVTQEFDIAVGFAGNTLTAQHFLNGLTEHLSTLRISFKEPRAGDLEMAVVMDCQPNPLDRYPYSRLEDDFEPRHYSKLLTAEKVAAVVLHSLRASMKSAKQYKLSQRAFNTLITPFVVGIQCPATSKYSIYVYRMESELVDGLMQVRVDMTKLPHDEVAVLGMEVEFAAPAQKAYAAAITAKNSQHQAMFDFLCASIDTVVARGGKGIARPAFAKTLERHRLKLTLRAN